MKRKIISFLVCVLVLTIIIPMSLASENIEKNKLNESGP
jgi:hypothetical protein